MFVEAFPKFQNARIVRALRAYFGSVWHVIVLALIMTLSAVLSLEIPAAYCYLAIVVLVCLFCEDTRGIVPVVVCVPMSLSIPNNPTHFSENIFTDNACLLQVGVCLILLFVMLIGRLVSILLQRPRRGVPKLTAGLAVLLVAYLVGGLRSPFYSGYTALFGFLEWLAIGLFYFYFYYTVDWKRAPKGYLAGVFTVIGFALVVQVLNMYFQAGVVTDGVINRSNLFPGWGTYNNIGGITAMCVPAIFYFAATQKHGWIFTLLATTVMMGVILTQSRGSILFGGIIYVVSAVIVIVKSANRERILHLIILSLIIITLAICIFCFREKLRNVFDALLKIGTDSDGREPLFKKAWQYFRDYPLFGVGWGGERWQGNQNNFLHYFMAHNTILQIFGSLGAFGMAAYLFHRFQTLQVVFRKFSMEKCFMGLIILSLLLMSMMDCHMFSFYPAMYYSVIFAFIECDDEREDREPLEKRRRRRKKKDGDLPPVRKSA